MAPVDSSERQVATRRLSVIVILDTTKLQLGLRQPRKELLGIHAAVWLTRTTDADLFTDLRALWRTARNAPQHVHFSIRPTVGEGARSRGGDGVDTRYWQGVWSV